MSEVASDPAQKRGRALFLSADMPWPRDGGGRIATLHILEGLARLYDVDLVAMADPVGEPDLSYLRSICGSVDVVRVPFTFGRHRIRQLATFARSLLSRDPYRVRKFRNREFENAVRRRVETAKYDLVHCDAFGTIQYAHLAPADACVTTADHNVESDIYRLAATQGNFVKRLLASLEERKLRRLERERLPAFDRVFVVAAEDGQILRELGVALITVLPMPAPEPWARRGTPPTGHRILTVGSMSWYGVADGLLWFHDRVLPLVRERVPDVEWELVGAHAPASIRALTSEPGVRLSGYVADLREVVVSARLSVVPLRIAGGMRMKLLDCLAWGIPAVSTSVGARGLDFRDGEGCYREDDPEAFARRIVELLTDDEMWLNTVDRGRSFIGEHRSAAAFYDSIEAGVEAAEKHRDLSGIGAARRAGPVNR